MPQPNYIAGLAYRILYVLYAVLLIQVSLLHKWGIIKMFWAFVASLIPFGTFMPIRFCLENCIVEKKKRLNI